MYIKLKFTNYEWTSLLQLLKIICEDLIPYYSTHCSDKSVMMYRVADLKVKGEANSLVNNRFHLPITSDFIYYFGENSLYKIFPTSKTCSCRWHLAYGTCKHIYKAFSLYDIQFDQANFFKKARKGREKMLKILKKNRSRIGVVFYRINIYIYYVRLTGIYIFEQALFNRILC